MKAQKVFLGRKEYGANLDGKLVVLADGLYDNIGHILAYGICKTDVFRHNSIRMINTGGTSAQNRIRLFNSSSRWSK